MKKDSVFDGLMSAQELADAVGLTKARISQLAPELEAAELAKRFGGHVVALRAAVDYIKARPERRGRPRKVSGGQK